MERELRMFEMNDEADPTALARSQLLRDRLPREYVTTRARCAINLRSVPNRNDDLWSFIMLPDAPVVSRLLLPFGLLATHRCVLDGHY
jgi:hypothetical protein